MTHGYKIGDEVSFIVKRELYHEGYSGGWNEHYDHDPVTGRVISASDAIVVIWPNDGTEPAFVKPEELFLAENYDAIKARIEQLNLECFGHKDGLWAANRVKKQS